MARFKSHTKALLAKEARIDAEVKAARDQVYNAAAPRTDVRFCDCLAMADQATKKRMDAADQARVDFQFEMVREGRAYFGACGRFVWY